MRTKISPNAIVGEKGIITLWTIAFGLLSVCKTYHQFKPSGLEIVFLMHNLIFNTSHHRIVSSSPQSVYQFHSFLPEFFQAHASIYKESQFCKSWLSNIYFASTAHQCFSIRRVENATVNLSVSSRYRLYPSEFIKRNWTVVITFINLL